MNTNSELDDAQFLAALKLAVAMMGFDPKKLAQFVAAPGDDMSKRILLSSLVLNVERIREGDGSNVAIWQSLLDGLRPQPTA